MKTNVNINGKTVEITLTEEQVKQLSDSVKPKNKRWRAGIYGKYFICASQSAKEIKEVNDEYDNGFYAQGNYFETETEAELELTRRIKKQQILDRISELNDGWEPDWSRISKNKFYVYYSYSDNCYRISNHGGVKVISDSHYLASQAVAQQLIKEFGDDLKYLFE
jgi:hypothetical protein